MRRKVVGELSRHTASELLEEGMGLRRRATVDLPHSVLGRRVSTEQQVLGLSDKAPDP